MKVHSQHPSVLIDLPEEANLKKPVLSGYLSYICNVGVVVMILGCVYTALGVLLSNAHSYFAYTTIWCGILIIIAGGIGITIALIQYPRCLVLINMLLSFTSVVCFALQLSFGIVSTIEVFPDEEIKTKVLYISRCAVAFIVILLLISSGFLSLAALGRCCKMRKDPAGASNSAKQSIYLNSTMDDVQDHSSDFPDSKMFPEANHILKGDAKKKKYGPKTPISSTGVPGKAVHKLSFH